MNNAIGGLEYICIDSKYFCIIVVDVNEMRDVSMKKDLS